MKIYTQTYDLAKASPHRFWVAPFSEFKIGIKILEKDEISSKDFTLKAGSIEFTPDEDKIDNFTLYTIKSNDTGFVDYTIEVEGVAEKLKLMQIVTDSTVFEIDAGGGGDVPADVATQTWVNSQISDFITEDALDGYATESYVDSAISDFVEEDELTAYAEKADLTAYATKDELTAYAETSDIKDSTITFTQGGVTKGSFTLNQATSATIALDAGGGDMSNYYTKSETNGLLSAKADATKQLPADLTSWITDGWTHNYESDFTKLTAGFYDISPYCDYTVSAQYVYGWNGYYYTTYLFSYCTNGKTVFCHQVDGRDVMDGTDYEGNISGNPSCYFEVDTTKIPNDESLGDYLYDSSVVDPDSVKWFAYVSQNMDGNAPYTLQELTTFGDNDPQQIGNNEFYHVATEDVTPGFVEVSAVYDNQISSKVDQQYLQDNYLDSDNTYQAIDNQIAGALEDYYPKTETSSATEIGTALEGKQPAGNYLTAETEPAFAAMSADIVVDGDLTAYYTKSETSSATEIGTALEGKQPAGNYLTAETDPTFNTWLSGEEVGIGWGVELGPNSRAIAIGFGTKAYSQYSVAIGAPNCTVAATNAIQLGQGFNGQSNTFNVFNYQMLSSDGKIPNERLHLSALSESDWATLSGSADAGTFYFVY